MVFTCPFIVLLPIFIVLNQTFEVGLLISEPVPLLSLSGRLEINKSKIDTGHHCSFVSLIQGIIVHLSQTFLELSSYGNSFCEGYMLLLEFKCEFLLLHRHVLMLLAIMKLPH